MPGPAALGRFNRDARDDLVYLGFEGELTMRLTRPPSP
jgi:hypothetical protein